MSHLGASGDERVMHGALSLALQEETGSLRGWAELFSVRHTDAREVYRTPRVRAQKIRDPRAVESLVVLLVRGQSGIASPFGVASGATCVGNDATLIQRSVTKTGVRTRSSTHTRGCTAHYRAQRAHTHACSSLTRSHTGLFTHSHRCAQHRDAPVRSGLTHAVEQPHSLL